MQRRCCIKSHLIVTFYHPLVACNAESADCVARTLSCIADVLSEMAGDKVGLRSGPAANENWMHAYRLLEVRNHITYSRSLGMVERSHVFSFCRREILLKASRNWQINATNG